MDRDIGYGPEANEPWYWLRTRSIWIVNWLRTRSIWTMQLVTDPRHMNCDIGYGPEAYEL